MRGPAIKIFLSSKHAVYLVFILRGKNEGRAQREEIREKFCHRKTKGGE